MSGQTWQATLDCTGDLHFQEEATQVLLLSELPHLQTLLQLQQQHQEQLRAQLERHLT